MRDLMKQFWAERAGFYGNVNDLEEIIRNKVADFIKELSKSKAISIVELGCGNGRLLKKIADFNNIKLTGVDYSKEMLDEAKRCLKRVNLINSDIEDFILKEVKSDKKYDVVVIINTLHNLYSRQKIFEIIKKSSFILKPNGYLIFDIRNIFNPFINFGYRKNLKKGLHFYTNSFFKIRNLLKEINFSYRFAPIFYQDLKSSGREKSNFFKKILYSFYLKITRLKLFAPYILIISQKKTTKFISIIWGYHKQLYFFSKKENYHITPLEIAKKLGYKPLVYQIGPIEDIVHDPNFDKTIPVINFSNFFSYLKFLWKNRREIIYANTLVWQSLFVPFICRNSIFMAHDSVKRKTWLKQKIQNFIFKKFRGIRVISPDEKGFLISEGVSEEKISIIPIPIDVNTFRYINNKERSGIVFLGNVTPDKDIKTILNALFFVKKNYPNIKMDIIGEIRDDNFYNLLNKYELKENVFIRGFVPHKDLAHILNNYKIYVNSSISEGQCLAAYEAVSCGTALCLPETLSFKSVFSKKALFHKIGDPETLAKNIISYLKNENLRQTHVKLCQQMIKKYYNPETLNKKLKNLFAINNLTESKKRERILVVAPEIHYPLIEGIQKSAWDVIKAANIKGFYPIVLTQYSYGKPFPEVLNNKFLTEYVFRNYRAKALKFLNWFFVGLKTLILIRKEQIKKCLFFSLDYPFIFSFFFSIISGAEIRLFIFSLREINGVRRMFLKLLKRRIKIIVQTEYVKNEILNIGFKNKQVFVAPFMPNKLQYEKIEDDIKRASNLFIYMSNATKEAGIYDIIECARKVSNLEFVLAIRKFTEKEENDFYQLISFIEKNKIKNIKIKRNIKTPKLLLERATAIIIPPKNQLVSMSFPILIMEAFLTKTPVIASDLPIFSFLKDEGLITTYKTLNELIEILTQFDEKNYSYKIEKSFKWAKQLISAEEVFNKYVI